MAIGVTNIGNIGNTSATAQLTGVTVPAGSLIIACTSEVVSASSGGSISDSASNAYTRLVSGNNTTGGASQGFGAIYYAWNSAAISSGTLTYTKLGSNKGGLSAFYATGANAAADPVDASVTQTATGNTATAQPNVTGGAPAVSGELIVGVVQWAGGTTDTFTQDIAHGFAAPPAYEHGSAADNIAGGTLVNSGTGTSTFAPTTNSASKGWIAFVVGFKPVPLVAITPAGLTLSSPVIDAPIINQKDAFSAAPLTTSSPTIGSSAIGQVHALSTPALAVSSPAFGAISLVQIHSLAAAPLTVAPPITGSSNIFQTHTFVTGSITVASPLIPAGAFTQKQAFATASLAAGPPSIQAPALS